MNCTHQDVPELTRRAKGHDWTLKANRNGIVMTQTTEQGYPLPEDKWMVRRFEDLDAVLALIEELDQQREADEENRKNFGYC